MAYKNILGGGCHCGSISLELHTDKDETTLVPRTCQCTLCRKHGASWISDPDGEAHLRYDDSENVSLYRFGHGTSDFIVCRKCGVLVTALCEVEGRTRAVLNIKTMLDHAFTSDPVMTNFDAEDVDQRLSRRGRNWTGKVVITGNGG